MAEYIERGRLQTAIQKGCKPWGYDYYRYVMDWSDCLTRVRDMVREAPAADVAPVVHGRWIIGVDNDDFDVKCSKCEWTDIFEVAGISAVERIAKAMHYCPNCGAKMDGGTENATD